jgi:hypothetical protein
MARKCARLMLGQRQRITGGYGPVPGVKVVRRTDANANICHGRSLTHRGKAASCTMKN